MPSVRIQGDRQSTRAAALSTAFGAVLALASGGLLAADLDARRAHLEHDDDSEPVEIIREVTASLCEDGMAGGFPCRNVDLLARVTPQDLGAQSARDNWGWKDPITGRYYALVGLNNGVGFVDVTEPDSPRILGTLPSAQPDGEPTSSGWRDVKVHADHAFVVADAITGHGMQVFDLARLRDVETPQTFDADAWYRNVGAAHNIAINEETGWAYLVGSNTCAGGLHMVDISDPLNPANARCYTGDGYTHDTQCVVYRGPDAEHEGREICFASNEDSVTIVDVTDKDQPLMINRVEYPNTGYTHQGWLTDDQAWFVFGDEADELNSGVNARTVVLRLDDLDSAAFAFDYISTNPTIDHNLYVRDGYVYQANYTAGLRILDASGIAAGELTEAGYFDTSPTVEDRVFQGAWNVYPFFDNGVLLVNDIQNGLFLLRSTLPLAHAHGFDGRMSGVWVAEGLEDQGINLFVGENINGPVLYFTWFLYLGGEPFWLTGSTAFEAGAETVDVVTQRLEGLGYLETGPDRALRTDIGTVRLRAQGCDSLQVTYDLDEGLGAGELFMTSILSAEGRECTTSEGH